eukprot:scaffold174098_cov31-Tisochrysis_lutea.AAC.2
MLCLLSTQTHASVCYADKVDADMVRAYLESEMQKRIMVIDGAMGTTIQQYKFTEADFRGEPRHSPSAVCHRIAL